MNKFKKSLSWASNGLKTVWIEEQNFRIEVFIALAVIIFGVIEDLSRIEWALIWIAIAMVLGSETLNTAVEDICNKIEPSQNPTIGKIKDIMAAFVLISCIGATLIGFIVFF